MPLDEVNERHNLLGRSEVAPMGIRTMVDKEASATACIVDRGAWRVLADCGLEGVAKGGVRAELNYVKRYRRRSDDAARRVDQWRAVSKVHVPYVALLGTLRRNKGDELAVNLGLKLVTALCWHAERHDADAGVMLRIPDHRRARPIFLKIDGVLFGLETR